MEGCDLAKTVTPEHNFPLMPWTGSWDWDLIMPRLIQPATVGKHPLFGHQSTQYHAIALGLYIKLPRRHTRIPSDIDTFIA